MSPGGFWPWKIRRAVRPGAGRDGWPSSARPCRAPGGKRTIPETSQRVLNSILEDQRTAFRYDRQARNFIRLIGETHEDAKALFAASQGPHDPALDWTGIRERKDALQKVIDHLPPADEFEPYLAHYDGRANSALGDVMMARLNRNLQAAARQQIEVPAAQLFELTTETVELRGNLRRTMREGGLAVLHDNADLKDLREVARKLGQAVSSGSDAFDSELERHGTNFSAIENLAADTFAAISTIDRRLDEHVAGAARDLIRLRDEAQHLCDTPFPDGDVRAARLIGDFEETLSALQDKLTTLPPIHRVDATLHEFEADLSVSSLRADLNRFHAHLRLANRAFYGDGAESHSERQAETLEHHRQEDAAVRDQDRSQAPEEAAARRQKEQKTEEDRSISRDEDTGMSIL